MRRPIPTFFIFFRLKAFIFRNFIWLYFFFAFRNIEEILAEKGEFVKKGLQVNLDHKQHQKDTVTELPPIEIITDDNSKQI